MSEPIHIQTVRLRYKDREFILIPSHYKLNIREMSKYLNDIGDLAFIVDDEIYFEESAMFNVIMKYSELYTFI